MNWPDKERWAALWRTARSANFPIGWYDRLRTAYSEPQRHYHTQQHISDCLDEFDQSKHLVHDPVTVELAIWFHDAVYDPKAADNEERSANMAKLCLAEAGLETSLTTTLTSLIMATKSHLPTDPDSRVLVDVDLSIFGQGDARFFDYEKQIRLEYLWVPQTVFNSKRAEILQRFLDREHIFQTASFRKRYETQARKNLQRSIARLKSLD